MFELLRCVCIKTKNIYNKAQNGIKSRNNSYRRNLLASCKYNIHKIKYNNNKNSITSYGSAQFPQLFQRSAKMNPTFAYYHQNEHEVCLTVCIIFVSSTASHRQSIKSSCSLVIQNHFNEQQTSTGLKITIKYTKHIRAPSTNTVYLYLVLSTELHIYIFYTYSMHCTQHID